MPDYGHKPRLMEPTDFEAISRLYPRAPERIRLAITAYVEQRREAGHFVMAVLRNDLFDAVGRADAECLAGLQDITRYVYNEAPGDCWGSPERVNAHLAGR